MLFAAFMLFEFKVFAFMVFEFALKALAWDGLRGLVALLPEGAAWACPGGGREPVVADATSCGGMDRTEPVLLFPLL